MLPVGPGSHYRLLVSTNQAIRRASCLEIPRWRHDAAQDLVVHAYSLASEVTQYTNIRREREGIKNGGFVQVRWRGFEEVGLTN
jgi:hypothetical protein